LKKQSWFAWGGPAKCLAWEEKIMKARRSLGLGLVVLTMMALGFAGVPVLGSGEGQEHRAHFIKCAKSCAECAVQCDACHHHCMHKVTAGNKEHAKSMELCSDCADYCRLAATLSARHSSFALGACEGCAKVCDTCAASCEAIKADQQMAECAKSCRDCAKACRDMVKMVKQ
jgi:hypothetical protein